MTPPVESQPSRGDDKTRPTEIRVLTGPTAAGKTAWALELAARHDLEIVSMDSMAIYRRMDIGTAKPSAEERARAAHHLIDIVDPHERFDTAAWCEAADRAVAEIRARGREPLIVGGTPLYLMAFGKGMVENAGRDDALRQRLEAEEDARPGTLHERVLALDPEAGARLHRKDRKRLIRALEVHALTGKTLSEQQRHFEAQAWRQPCRIAAVLRERADLHERVKIRTRAMLEAGLLDEVRAIRDDRGFSQTAAGAIGYAECLDFLRGRYKDEEELRNRIRRNTHRLIRKQLNWLRRIEGVRWIRPEQGLAAVEAALFP